MIYKLIQLFRCYILLQHEFVLQVHSFGAYDQELWEECKHCKYQGRTF